MTAKGKFTQAEVTRLIKGATAAGLEVEKLVIEPDGTLKVIIRQDGQPKDWEMGQELD